MTFKANTRRKVAQMADNPPHSDTLTRRVAKRVDNTAEQPNHVQGSREFREEKAVHEHARRHEKRVLQELLMLPLDAVKLVFVLVIVRRV